MKNKYYTPSIEEFCIGLKYEVELNKSTAGTVTKRVWEKCVFGTRSIGENLLKGKAIHHSLSFFDVLSSFISSSYIRIKYLDEEDIKHLGWKDDDNGFFSKNNYQLLTMDFSRVTIYYIRYKHGGDRNDTILFDGKVKNISELKIILKQIGI